MCLYVTDRSLNTNCPCVDNANSYILSRIYVSLSLYLSLSHSLSFSLPLLLLSVISLVSIAGNEVVHTLGSLRKVTGQGGTKGVVKTGMVVDPVSSCLVLDGSLGFLQFYDPKKDAVRSQVHRFPCHVRDGDTACFSSPQLEVVRRNMISRPFDTPLTPTTIDRVAFSPDGAWLAVVGLPALFSTSHFPSSAFLGPSHYRPIAPPTWGCL